MPALISLRVQMCCAALLACAAAMPRRPPQRLRAPVLPCCTGRPPQRPSSQNTGIWRAPPLLVSGASAYIRGEYLYQGFLYDDHGARELPDPNDRRSNNQFSSPNGSYTYPSNPAYAENAANLLEFRVKPTADATAFRITLNTMTDPRLIAVSVALGGAPGVTHPFPFGANVVAPADEFLTVHPQGNELVASLEDAVTGKALAGPAPVVSVDAGRHQIEVLVPHADWNPRRRTVRLEAGVGLWDAANNAYLLPQVASSATAPGGSGGVQNPPAFFDAAFRAGEPGPVFGASSAQTLADPTWWRDYELGHVLATGDLSPLFTEVNFGKLWRGVTDERSVPRVGFIDRILASHFKTGTGADYSGSCWSGQFDCEYQGNLQPYLIYVPSRRPPRAGYGMTLLLHGNSANYNEFFGSRNASEFGDRGSGSIVLSPEARDPAGSYSALAAADVFEAWADVARHYHLNPAWTDISGYSLGGLGTYKLAEQFPDLFARAVAIVGSPGWPSASVPGGPSENVPCTTDYAPGCESTELASLRNIPIMEWDSIPVDELNPNSAANIAALQQLGYRYTYLTFPGEHLTPAFNDQFTPAAAFLGTDRVEPDPAHISYVYAYDTLDGLDRPTGDFPQFGLVADHAYWISQIKLRNQSDSCVQSVSSTCGSTGSVDAVSGGFGVGDPTPSGPTPGAGVLTGGDLVPVLPYTSVTETWGSAPRSPATDTLSLTVSNIATLTIDVARAHVDCAVKLSVSTDGPLTVDLDGCGRTVAFGS